MDSADVDTENWPVDESGQESDPVTAFFFYIKPRTSNSEVSNDLIRRTEGQCFVGRVRMKSSSLGLPRKMKPTGITPRYQPLPPELQLGRWPRGKATRFEVACVTL